MLKLLVALMKGKKTFALSLIPIILHQILKINGIDVPDEEMSKVIDLALALIGIVTKWLGNKREKNLQIENARLINANQNLVKEINPMISPRNPS